MSKSKRCFNFLLHCWQLTLSAKSDKAKAQVEGPTLDRLVLGEWLDTTSGSQKFTCLESKKNETLLCFPFCKDGSDGEVRDGCNLMFISTPTPLPPCPSSINLPSAGRGGGGDGRGHSARRIGGADHPWRDSRSRRPLPLHGRQQHRPARLHWCAAGGAMWVYKCFLSVSIPPLTLKRQQTEMATRKYVQ